MQPVPRVLFIDAYDSFSNNIISLLENELGVSVVKIFIDTHIEDLPSFLKSFDAVVCGPGPGHPSQQANVGLFTKIWTLHDCDLLPVLGICLGFQSLGLQFGGHVSQLPRPRHGLVTDIISSGESIFAEIPHARAVQYHSLHVNLGHDMTRGDTGGIWAASQETPDLLPLAWDFPSETSEDGTVNPPAILMGVRHTSKPFFGVQFHPESICSEESARSIIKNWWSEVAIWRGRDGSSSTSTSTPERLRASRTVPFMEEHFSRGTTVSTLSSRDPSTSPPSSASSASFSHNAYLKHVARELGDLTVPDVCELLQLTDEQVIILDSELRPMEGLGESSIIGLVETDTTKISYSINTNHVTVESNGIKRICSLEPYGSDIFTYLNDLLADRAITNHPESAFCGGLMGFVAYEAGLETIGIPAPSYPGRPDICFAFVERSLVLDHVNKRLMIQSLKPEDASDGENWVSKTAKLLEAASAGGSTLPPTTTACSTTSETFKCTVPAEAAYVAKIAACQDKIRAGESYEICLTDQTSIQFDAVDGALAHPWSRYRQQRQLNRAPFAAYLRLGPLTLLSSSPERFLRWSRPTLHPPTQPHHHTYASSNASSHDAREHTRERISTCQFRPIKGTVKKWATSKDKDAPARRVSLAEATAILATPKEQAENLMIVDLIRHDLHGVAGSGNVSVPALMVVEEYETVYQLVSVIEGRLPCPLLPRLRSLPAPSAMSLSSSHPAHADAEAEVEMEMEAEAGNECEFVAERRHHSGIDVLAAALPPGSMTGAPKRRACRLLRDIEGQRARSVYSGIVGYMCVTGKGDFSVVIRSAYRWDDERSGGGPAETWHIGAGGAITDLSTEEGEWEEMLTKLQGTLRAFAPAAAEEVFG